MRAAGCVFAEEEAALLHEAGGAHSSDTLLERLIERRVSGEPLETVLGWVEFCGRRWATAPGVFVPRRRTEALAELAVELAPAGGVAVDLCCGVGVLGAVLTWRRPDVEVHCTDLDPVAMRPARANLSAAGNREPLRAVHRGDLFTALPERLRGRVDLVVANVPYVPSAEIARLPHEARDFEPAVALDGGPDGLEVLRRLYRECADWVSPGAVLLSEAALEQAPDVVRAGAEAGLTVQMQTVPEQSTALFIARLG